MTKEVETFRCLLFRNSSRAFHIVLRISYIDGKPSGYFAHKLNPPFDEIILTDDCEIRWYDYK